jgi:hypothetical protein
MVRTALTCLAVILTFSASAIAAEVKHTSGMLVALGDGSVRNQSGPASSLSSGAEPTSCDCSNCSAEHCQPPSDSDVDGRDFLVWQRN